MLLDAADETIVPDAVTPKAGQIHAERLTKLSWVGGARYTLAKVTQDVVLNFEIEFSQLAAGAIVELDSPRWSGLL